MACGSHGMPSCSSAYIIHDVVYPTPVWAFFEYPLDCSNHNHEPPSGFEYPLPVRANPDRCEVTRFLLCDRNGVPCGKGIMVLSSYMMPEDCQTVGGVEVKSTLASWFEMHLGLDIIMNSGKQLICR